jgi:ribonuclease Z
MPPSAVGKAEPDNEPALLASSHHGDIGERSRSSSRVARKRPDLDIAVAFDHLNLTIGDMWKVNHYLPAIEQSFQDTIEDGDEEVDKTSVIEVDHT